MSTLPTPIAEVLRAEYLRLYGPDATLSSRRWEVSADDIIDAGALAQELKRREATPPRQGGVREFFRNLLRRFKRTPERMPEELEQQEHEVSHDPEYKRRVAAAVNSILGRSGWLFEDAAFADGRPLFEKLAAAKRGVDADDRFNANRIIFDALFSKYIRSGADRPYANVVKQIHARARQGKYRTALCISGGGIRSATFALGLLQGLAKRHLLQTFDFLSTVSGGGYIGSWLSSWARRNQWGIRGVSALLASQPESALDSEAPSLKHLRAYSNYLTPRLGLMSADTWALAATYVRNLLLNWLVLVPLLAAVLALPRLMMSGLTFRGDVGLQVDTAIWLTSVFGVFGLAWSLVMLISYRPVTETRRTKRLTDGTFITAVALPMLAAAMLLVTAWALYTRDQGEPPAWWHFVGGSTAACLVAFGIFLWKYWKAANVRRRSGGGAARVWGELGGSIVAGALGGLLAWLVTRYWFPQPIQCVPEVEVVRWPVEPVPPMGVTPLYVVFGVPVVLGILFLQAVVFVGAASKRNTDFDREWWARASGWMLLLALGWIAVSGIAIYGPVAIYHLPRALSAIGGTAGLFSLLAGKSGLTQAGGKKKGEESLPEKGTNIALSVAVPLFVLYLLALISLGTTWALRPADDAESVAQEIRTAQVTTREVVKKDGDTTETRKEARLPNVPRWRSSQHLRVVQESNAFVIAGIVAGGFALSFLMSLCLGVNVFSMHAMYRNRLVRAYLGASRWTREPNAFTGFDPLDNLNMDELRPEYFWAHSFKDIDDALEKLADTLRVLLAEERADLTGSDRAAARQALYTGLNRLIAQQNLTGTNDVLLRPLLNRRFIEREFAQQGVVVYPSPMPLICAQDILDADQFLAAFRHGGRAHAIVEFFRHKPPDLNELLADRKRLPVLLDEVNEVIAESQLPAPSDPERQTPFTLDSDPPHRMIRNRLYLESLLPEGAVAPLEPPRPLHVVNICLNLTSGRELAWQERKGEPFTVSPLAAGNYRLGYRDTRDYGGGISVGTAVTISGAAASPNMGYHSSPALAFLMTIFNVRLGWWLGNPGPAGTTTYKDKNPLSSIMPLLCELTGNTNEEYEYVYLSDGGHFENLGLYEMILRRAHRIVVSDAGADPRYAYDDLGNAIRKVKIDLGVTIRITHMGIIPPDRKKPGKYCAVATIDYKEVDGDEACNGEILYIKPVVYEDDQVPRDVLNYQATSSDFPHESTADQFFSESQFESYRRLGEYAIDQIRDAGGREVRSVHDLIESARRYLTEEARETGNGGPLTGDRPC